MTCAPCQEAEQAAIREGNLLWRDAHIAQILWLMEKHGITTEDLQPIIKEDHEATG